MGSDGREESSNISERLEGAGELSRVLRELVRANAEANHSLARRLGLGANDVAALDHLLQRDSLGPVELGYRLGMRPASATALADRLEAAGHVERRPHPTDRRRLTLKPPQHAVEEMRGAIRPLIDELNGVADEFTPDERRILARYVNLVADVLRDYGSGY
ncbi:MAG: MarR family winged helix-turn-helix transcriptional regulator [Rubrobacteraceae bacterium]